MLNSFLCVMHTKNSCFAMDYQNNIISDIEKNITFSYCDNIYHVNPVSIQLSDMQNKIMSSDFDLRLKVLNFALTSGINIENCFKYAFPSLYENIILIDERISTKPQNASIDVVKNSAKIAVNKAKNGIKIDKNALFLEIFNKFNNKNKNLNFEIITQNITPEVSDEDVSVYINQRSVFTTSFETSSESRKNNIKTALKNFDGIILNPDETLSFNQTTGIRNEGNGYEKAKIIKNGVFIDEFGGGVCQVSTTLYNAALLAGLEILEVHSHSLPVSYIEPCFDAMVNMGSSDLVIRNNLDYPVIFTTSSVNDLCKIAIFGQVNEYKILRKSEKVKELIDDEIIYTKDYSNYGFSEPLKVGEQKVLSYCKPGYIANGWLEYYKDDLLVKTQNIRNDRYNPKKQIILTGE